MSKIMVEVDTELMKNTACVISEDFKNGLIKKIESINPTDYGSISSYAAHNAVRDVKKDIIEIIKEYCGMEGKDGSDKNKS